MVDRRIFLKGVAGSVGLTLASPVLLRADDDGEWQAWRRDILAGRDALSGGITLDLPAVAENGAQVPLTVHVESPMSEDDHITAIHIIATRNPAPEIGSFHLTPTLTRAEVMTRIRVAEEQDIIVLAEASDGRVLEHVASIIVSIGGCVT